MTYERRSEALAAAEYLDMIQYCRPHGCKAERRFIRRFLDPLGMTTDTAGNRVKRIGHTPVMWSSHTDTVHGRGGIQKVWRTGNTVKLAPGQIYSDCLGADDTSGVWLMREMILARVPGLYVFHRGEECGAHGSQFIVDQLPNTVSGIKCAIALDRKGTGDIITHQGGRCCSDDFAKSLAGILGGTFAPSAQGVFTDTANYTGIVGECTNVSIGYQGQHTKNETQDISFLFELREKLLTFDCSKLDYHRQPGEKDLDDFRGVSRYFYDGAYGDDWMPGRSGRASYDSRVSMAEVFRDTGEEYCDHEWTTEEICREFPDEIAAYLESYDITAEQLLDVIEDRTGIMLQDYRPQKRSLRRGQ